jgi:N4-gp56 family major capsid protein
MLSATRVSATLYMVGHHAAITTYIDMVSINSVVQAAIDLFADSSAVTLDFMTSRLLLWKRTSASAQFQCSAGTGYLGDYWYCLSAGTYFKCLSSTTLQAPTYSINDLTTRNHTISALAGGISGTAWTPNIFRTIALKFKVKNVLRFEDGYYKAIMHPDMVNQLRGSSAFHETVKYVENGASTFMKGTLREGGERGLVGVIEGFKIYESTEAPLFSTSGVFGGTANGTRAKVSAYGGGRLYFTFLFGKGAYGVTDFDGGIRTFIKTPGPGDTSNPLNLYSTVGYRLIYTAKVLNNSACMWVVSGKPTTVGA